MLGCEGPVREQFSACSGIWALSLGATRLAFSDLPGTAKPVASICCKGPPLQTSKSNAVALFDFLEAPFYRRFRGASSEPISRPGPRNAAAGVPVRPRAPQPGPICTGSSVKPAGSEKVLRFGLEMSLCEPEMYPPQDPKKAKPCPACVCEAGGETASAPAWIAADCESSCWVLVSISISRQPNPTPVGVCEAKMAKLRGAVACECSCLRSGCWFETDKTQEPQVDSGHRLQKCECCCSSKNYHYITTQIEHFCFWL